MRIDKDGEPDAFYIAENFKRELIIIPMKKSSLHRDLSAGMPMVKLITLSVEEATLPLR